MGNTEMTKENESKKIGSRIRELRLQKGLSQLQLAELTGIKQGNITRIESGRHASRIDIISKIAEALDSKLDLIENTQDGI
jgi:transcriptional regulator with XRE-family HTH domain